MTKTLRVTARVAVLIALLALIVWTIYKPTLDEATKRREETITDVVSKGPVEVGHVRWTLDSLRVYTKLADAEGRAVELDAPAGASIVVAVLDIRPLAGLKMNNGFTCDAQLVDDQNNIWKAEDNVFGMALPTYCGDDDHPFVRNKSGKLMKVFVVPTVVVPRLLGVITPATGTPYPEKRVLIRA